jgi:hypothetical protein
MRMLLDDADFIRSDSHVKAEVSIFSSSGRHEHGIDIDWDASGFLLRQAMVAVQDNGAGDSES